MDALQAIARRRSIRQFKDAPIPDEVMEKVLTAAIQAPSGKNAQPWRFVVFKKDKRAEMVRIMRDVIERVQDQSGDIGSGAWTANTMEQTPVTVFVFNANAENTPGLEWTSNVVDVQSIRATIQNMLLAAWELGIGSLWICDVFYAYAELCEWLGETREMIAAVSLGYADESPAARPRKPVDEVTRWF